MFRCLSCLAQALSPTMLPPLRSGASWHNPSYMKKMSPPYTLSKGGALSGQGHGGRRKTSICRRPRSAPGQSLIPKGHSLIPSLICNSYPHSPAQWVKRGTQLTSGTQRLGNTARPVAPHPPPSRWHTAASASSLLCGFSWPPPYLPHQILMIQVSDKPQGLSMLRSA